MQVEKSVLKEAGDTYLLYEIGSSHDFAVWLCGGRLGTSGTSLACVLAPVSHLMGLSSARLLTMDLWLAFGTVCHFGAVSDAHSDIRELINGDVGEFSIWAVTRLTGSSYQTSQERVPNLSRWKPYLTSPVGFWESERL